MQYGRKTEKTLNVYTALSVMLVTTIGTFWLICYVTMTGICLKITQILTPNGIFCINKILDILAVMCPFKRYRQCEVLKPWLTPEIYRQIRYCESCVKLFRLTRHHKYLLAATKLRNSINVLVDNGKADFFKNALNKNKNNPKKFWRIIKNFTTDASANNVLPDFKHPVSNVPIPHDQIPDYLNRYFVDTSERLNNDNSQICFPDVAGLYDIEDFLYLENDLPTSDEILYYVNEIDVNKSSSVLDDNTKYCIEAIKAIPDILCGIYCTSITTGMFPRLGL